MTSTQTLGADWVRRWAHRSQEVIAENRIHLIELDRAIGDGDHGDNLDRGFTAVASAIDALDDDAGADTLLRTIATTLLSTVGGASGPLFGTAFLRASTAAGSEALDSRSLAAVLTAAHEGVAARGKAEVGEKTMIDALAPAAAAARQAAEAGVPPVEVLRAAAGAAETGAEATEPLEASKGRASFLGPRSVGHRDPGAESSALILRAAAEVADG